MIDDKQIEEFAQDIWDNLPDYEHNFRDCRDAAKELSAKGYCKASDIFEDVFDHMLGLLEYINYRSPYQKDVALNNFGIMKAKLRKKYSGEDINVPTKEDTKTCEGCCNIAFRYPSADMYPCNCCSRAHQKDYYNIPVED